MSYFTSSVLAISLLALLSIHICCGEESADTALEAAHDSVESRGRRATAGQTLDKGIATVSHPVESAEKGLNSVGKGLNNAGKAIERKGQNVGKAIESRRRRATAGQHLDRGINTVKHPVQKAQRGLNKAGNAVKRKGQNVGKAIQSRRRRETFGGESMRGIF